MRRSKWIMLVFCLFLLFHSVPSMAGAAKDVSFRMTIVEKGDQVEATVHADQVDDLYAYDITLEANAEKLELISAKSEMAGFAVGPIIKGDLVQYVNTKTGSSPGVNGNRKLATFTFKRLLSDSSVIQLNEVKLVNSKLDMTEYKPMLQIAVDSFAPWSDIVGYWAEAAIRQAIERGIVKGYEDGNFRPQRDVTRAEFAAMLVRALKLPVNAQDELAFKDKDQIPEWARPYIAAAIEAELIVGYEDGTFRADKSINREEICAVMVRALGIEMSVEADLSYVDHDQISEWASPYIAAATNAGIMNGRGGNQFAPKQLATRAEAAVVLLR